MTANEMSTPEKVPITSVAGCTCRVRNGVRIASTHQVRRPTIISQAYATPSAAPTTAPARATTAPSVNSRQRTRRSAIQREQQADFAGPDVHAQAKQDGH